jgi:hypothetical protein
MVGMRLMKLNTTKEKTKGYDLVITKSGQQGGNALF